jgi:hypothetical protein
MRNRSGAISVRYVEHQNFRLWQYLMANKHHLQVDRASLCLWLATPEWNQQPGYFKAAGNNEAVTLLRFELFDSANAIHDRIQRFAPSAVAQQLQTRLLQRVPQDVQNLPDFGATLVPGWAIVQEPGADLTTLGQALSADELLPNN